MAILSVSLLLLLLHCYNDLHRRRAKLTTLLHPHQHPVLATLAVLSVIAVNGWLLLPSSTTQTPQKLFTMTPTPLYTTHLGVGDTLLMLSASTNLHTL